MSEEKVTPGKSLIPYSADLIKQASMYCDLDLAWAAGFLDGEGSISMGRYTQYRNGKLNYYLHVDLGNTNKAVIVRFRDWFGGTIRVIEGKTVIGGADKLAGRLGLIVNRKRQYRWYIYSKRMCKFLRLILPYLVVKRPQAELALEYWELMNEQHKRGKVLTEEEMESRKALYLRMKELNNGGEKNNG